jgi:hypothetical protein
VAGAQKEMTECLCKLAESSRQIGIHIIMATRGPVQNEVPKRLREIIQSRIAFQVFSKKDSVAAIGIGGAEEISRCGEMLFRIPGTVKPIRIQGALTLDAEIKLIQDYILKSPPRPVINPADRPDGSSASDWDKVLDQMVADGAVIAYPFVDGGLIRPLSRDKILYKKGFQALNNGFSEEALKYFEQTTRFADGCFMTAQIYAKNGNYHKALEYALEAKSLKSDLGCLTRELNASCIVGSYRISKYAEMDIVVSQRFVDMMIAEAYHHLGKDQEACDIYVALESEYPMCSEMKLLLSNFLLMVAPADISSLEYVVEKLNTIDYSGVSSPACRNHILNCCLLKADALAKLCRYDEALEAYGLMIPAKSGVSLGETQSKLIFQAIQEADILIHNHFIAVDTINIYRAKRAAVMAAS